MAPVGGCPFPFLFLCLFLFHLYFSFSFLFPGPRLPLFPFPFLFFHFLVLFRLVFFSTFELCSFEFNLSPFLSLSHWNLSFKIVRGQVLWLAAPLNSDHVSELSFSVTFSLSLPFHVPFSFSIWSVCKKPLQMQHLQDSMAKENA